MVDHYIGPGPAAAPGRSSIDASSGVCGDQRGYVLIWALFAFVILTSLATMALRSSGSERRLSKAASGWNQSFYAAEAGLEAALQVTPDSLLEALAPGDSIDLGWRSLGGAIDYHAVFRRVDDGSLDLFLLRSTGRNPGLFGGQTTVNLAFTTAGDPSGGVLLDTNLTISGTTEVNGECRVHANDWVYIPGELVTNGPVTSGGLVEGNVDTSGATDQPFAADSDLAATDLSGYSTTDGTDTSKGTVESYADEEPVERVSPHEMCDAADFKLGDGGLSSADGGESQFGHGDATNWRSNGPGKFELFGPPMPGTYCVDGSVTITGDNINSAGGAVNLTVLASGTIEANGNGTMLSAAHPEGVLFAASGDVLITGNSSYYGGGVLTAAQCEFSGDAITFDGELICRGEPDPPGVENLVDQNTFGGDLRLIAECGGVGGATAVAKPLTERAWWRGY